MTTYAITCQDCLVCVWHGDDLVTDDGQEILTAYADSTCQRDACPHTTNALNTAPAGDPLALIEALQARLAALEAANPPKRPSDRP